MRLVEPSIRKATNRFARATPSRLPQVRGNPQRIEQVVVNLLLNACQALPDHRTRHLSAHVHELRPERAWCCSPCRDEGIGIAAGASLPAHRSLLHHQAGERRHRAGALGLGGHREGTWRHPQLRLAAGQRHHRNPYPAHLSRRTKHERSTTYPHFGILLVDDEPAWLRSVSLTLERPRRDHQYRHLPRQPPGDGHAGRATTSSLVLLDLTMPHLRGKTCLR